MADSNLDGRTEESSEWINEFTNGWIKMETNELVKYKEGNDFLSSL